MFSLYLTDTNNKIVFDQNINSKKQNIINHMIENKKTMMMYHGFFVNLVQCDDVSSDK